MKTSFIGVGSGVVDAPFSSTSFFLDTDYKWMKLSITFSKKGWYSLFVWDPRKQLRVQSLYIGEAKELVLSTISSETSFSCVPGEILPGEWKLEVLAGTYSEHTEFHFSFECGHESSGAASDLDYDHWISGGKEAGLHLDQFNGSRKLKSGHHWYKGDFHTHTTESDGKMTPQEGMAQAKKMGLDYFAATDHNILPSKWVKDDMLTIPGIEITSTKGHFNALGLKEWIDWRPTCPDGGMETEEGMNRILSEVKEAGALVSINHPMLKPWEWQFRTTPLSSIDVIEIWNDPTYKDNPQATEEALKLWDILWNDGHRIYGIGGSDSHLRPDESYEKNGPPSVIGDPATYVFADGLSADAIFAGVRNGNVYVSRGPVIDCEIVVNGECFRPGSELNDASCGEQMEFTYQVNYIGMKEEESRIHWILNGHEVKRSHLQKAGTLTEHFQWKTNEANWLRFEIRKSSGELLAIVNPVFIGKKQTSLTFWGELLGAAGFIG